MKQIAWNIAFFIVPVETRMPKLSPIGQSGLSMRKASILSRMEKSEKLQRGSVKKIAAAFGIAPEQID